MRISLDSFSLSDHMVFIGKLSPPTLTENPKSFHKIKISTQNSNKIKIKIPYPWKIPIATQNSNWNFLEIPFWSVKEGTHPFNLIQLVSRDEI
jgi:hypothetical protein